MGLGRSRAGQPCQSSNLPTIGQIDALLQRSDLRAGSAGFSKDSEFGGIFCESLESGWTHGTPDGRFPNFETRATEGGWVQAKLPVEALFELTRTPNFITWQGALWLFSGAEPMIYVGEWNKRDFEARCPSTVSPEEFFRQVLRRADTRLWKDADNLCIYVFRDRATGAHAAYFDMD